MKLISEEKNKVNTSFLQNCLINFLLSSVFHICELGCLGNFIAMKIETFTQYVVNAVNGDNPNTF